MLAVSTRIQERPASDSDHPVLGFLSHVRASVAQLRLYPKESAQVLKVSTIAYQAFHDALADSASITLNGTSQGLLVNGQRPPVTGAGAQTIEQGVLRLLADSKIRSATFRRGLELDELITFLHALTHKFWDVNEGKEINRRLREERVTRISVDEVEYVALGQGDLVIKDAARRLEGAETRVAEVMKQLESLVEGTVDEGTAAEVRLQVLQKLLDHDPTLLDRAKSGTPAGEGEGSEQAGRLDFESGRQALGEVARLMQGADEETRARLRRIGDAIVGAFRHSMQLHGMMREFLKDGAADLIPGWLKQAEEERPKEPAAVVRAHGIASLEAEKQIEAIAHEGAGLLKELEALGRTDLLSETLGLLVAFVQDRSADRRAAACDAMAQVKGVLDSAPAAEIRARLEQAVRGALEAEGEAAVYPKLASTATSFVESRIRGGDLTGAIDLLDLLRRHAQVKDADNPRRADQAFQALERVASGGGFTVVQERLREGDPEAMRLVETLDAAATRFLVAQIKGAEGAADRVRYAETISRAGPGAAAILIDATQKTTIPSDALRLMEVLPSAAPEKMVEVALDGLLRHPAIAVRRRAALMLAERAYPRGGSLLLGALATESDAAVRATFVEALGQLRCRDAVEVICELADGRHETDEVRSEACLSLGRIGDRAAIQVLVRLCMGGGTTLSKFFRPITREVRVAATRALGSFPDDMIARETLRRALSDPMPAVRAAAREAAEAPIAHVPAPRPAGDARAGSWKLAGALGEVPLDQVCQLIAAAGKSGLLTLHFDSRKARVFFEEGFVVAADFEGKRDQAAFNAFCRRSGGHFAFTPGEAAAESRFRAPVAQFLLEAFRVADEAAKAPPDAR